MLASLEEILSKARPPRRPVAICAHRGNSSEAPENTLAAFQSAVDLGVDLVELDVRLTKDKRLVIHHDDQLGRTANGSGHIEDHTLDEIKRLDAGSWFGPEFAGEKIPTLEESLDLLGPHCTTLVEIKIKKDRYDLKEMAEAVLTATRSSEIRSRVILQSFDAEILCELRSLDPDVPLGFLTSNSFPPFPQELADLALSGVNPDRRLATEEAIAELHDRGLWTLPWTIDDPEEMREKIRAGADGLITNRPRTMVELLAP